MCRDGIEAELATLTGMGQTHDQIRPRQRVAPRSGHSIRMQMLSAREIGQAEPFEFARVSDAVQIEMMDRQVAERDTTRPGCRSDS